MAGWRQAVALAMTGEEIEALTALSRSRTEPAGRVSRAAMLLGYREKPSFFFAVGRRLGVHHQTVQRCVERAMAYGALAALDDRPRPGAKSRRSRRRPRPRLVSLACDKAKEHGYPHELWTTRLLARHARERGPGGGSPMSRPSGSRHRVQASRSRVKSSRTRCATIWNAATPSSSPRWRKFCGVYREVQVLKKAAAKAGEIEEKPVSDRLLRRGSLNPGHRHDGTGFAASARAAMRASRGIMRYKRHGTLSLLAGIDLLTGKVHALVRERHRSREFIEFPQASRCRLSGQHRDQADPRQSFRTHFEGNLEPGSTLRPPGRFDFTFTPKHGLLAPSLIEGFFSTVRPLRPAPYPSDIKARTQATCIMAGIDDVNRHPVIHTWSYKLAEAA